LTWVEWGNVDAGIVYQTDAQASEKVTKVADAPSGSHKPIIYPASVIKTSKNKDAAKAFLHFISSEKGKLVFEKFGFKFLEN
jgi:molybdate transport system substrate-binding protein